MSSDAVSSFGRIWEVIRHLFHEVHDHGGGDDSVFRLLSEPELRKRVAKTLVGPVWDLADGEPFDLPFGRCWTPSWLIDSLEDEGVKVHPTVRKGILSDGEEAGSTVFQRSNPPAMCRYALEYIGRWHVDDLEELRGPENAGFLELCELALKYEFWPADVVALGSHSVPSVSHPKVEDVYRRECEITFPRLLSTREERQISWIRPEPQTHSKFFRLVRVY